MCGWALIRSFRLVLSGQARSLEQKREWCLQLKRAIMESFSAVIPSHAKQLVLELGQTKSQSRCPPLAVLGFWKAGLWKLEVCKYRMELNGVVSFLASALLSKLAVMAFPSTEKVTNNSVRFNSNRYPRSPAGNTNPDL